MALPVPRRRSRGADKASAKDVRGRTFVFVSKACLTRSVFCRSHISMLSAARLRLRGGSGEAPHLGRQAAGRTTKTSRPARGPSAHWRGQRRRLRAGALRIGRFRMEPAESFATLGCQRPT